MVARVLSAALLLLIAHLGTAAVTYRSCRSSGNTYETYNHGANIPNENPCMTCRCNNGAISCDMESCPELYCPDSYKARADGECCNTCPPGCSFRDNWYGPGPVVTGNPCEICDCNGDEVNCAAIDCPRPRCPPEVQYTPDGECCPRCPDGCDFRDNWYGIGNIETSDPCETCVCRNNEANCAMAGCPPLACPAHVQYTNDGECCPQCPDGCDFRDNWYGVGNIETSDPCEICECQNNEPICAMVGCAPLDCPVGVRYTPDGECCPKCPDGCTYNANWYGVGNFDSGNPCETCTCGPDGASCQMNPCPVADCPDYMQEDYGSCGCRRCRTGCDYDNSYYAPATPIATGDPCKTCECSPQGRLECEEEECPDASSCPSNRMTAAESGVCCPSCVTGCSYKDNYYGVGTFPDPEDSNCKECTCSDNGDVVCLPTQYCPRLACRESDRYKPYGQCCERCRTRTGYGA